MRSPQHRDFEASSNIRLQAERTPFLGVLNLDWLAFKIAAIADTLVLSFQLKVGNHRDVPAERLYKVFLVVEKEEADLDSG